MSIKKFVTLAILVSVIVTGGISYFASSHPDGLEKVSADKGLDVNVADSAVANSIFADYGISGVDNSTGLAGIVGIAITGLVGFALIKWVSRSSTKS